VIGTDRRAVSKNQRQEPRSDVAPNGAGRDFLCGAIKILLLAELVLRDGICSPNENLLFSAQSGKRRVMLFLSSTKRRSSLFDQSLLTSHFSPITPYTPPPLPLGRAARQLLNSQNPPPAEDAIQFEYRSIGLRSTTGENVRPPQFQ